MITDYCRRPKLQYNTIFNSHLYYNTLVVLQYNFQPICNTIPILQYNSSLSPPIAIHFLMLQYNLALSSKSQHNIVYCTTLTQPHQSCNTMPWLAIQLSCNTIILSQYNFYHSKPSLAIQFSTHQAISQYKFFFS